VIIDNFSRLSSMNSPGKHPTSVAPDSICSSDSKSVLSLQNAIKGKKVVVTGGTPFTAEAFEFDHKMRLLQQLKLARTLRCTMEGALDEAKKVTNAKDAKKIFYNSKGDMLQLASLTNAVIGRYTLDSYEEYNDIHQKQEEDEQKSFQSSHEYLNGLRQRMLWEDSPSTFYRDNHSQMTLHEQEIAIANLKSSEDKAASTVTVSKNEKKIATGGKNEKKKPSKSHKTAKPNIRNTHILERKIETKLPSDLTSSKQKGSKSRELPLSKYAKHTKVTKVAKVAKVAKVTKVIPQKKTNSDVKKTKDTTIASHIETKKDATKTVKKQTKRMDVASTIARHYGKMMSISSTSSNPTSSKSLKSRNEESKTKEDQRKISKNVSSQVTQKPVAQKVAKKVKPKNNKKQTRKCHQCKEIRVDYFTCGYWFANGNRCKKVFCSLCIATYDDIKGSNADDWHCPSCLGICKCPVCMKERERESLRSTKRRRLRG
jgi:hypothetical protein